jgi:superfamily II DNA or RNA helicase
VRSGADRRGASDSALVEHHVPALPRRIEALNPLLKVIGFTATPYRLDSGLLHEGDGAIFTDIAYEVSVRDLIDQGYLSPSGVQAHAPRNSRSPGVGTRGGEFIARELHAAVDRDDLTERAVAEIVALRPDRRSWLVFCSGVAHARACSRRDPRARHLLRGDRRRDAERRARRDPDRRLQARRDPLR